MLLYYATNNIKRFLIRLRNCVILKGLYMINNNNSNNNNNNDDNNNNNNKNNININININNTFQNIR